MDKDGLSIHMAKFSLIRFNTSKYQAPNFKELESMALAHPDINYILPKDYESGPVILVTNSNTNPQEIPEKIQTNIVYLIHPNSGHDNLKDWLKTKSFPVSFGSILRTQAVTEYILYCLFDFKTPNPFRKHWDTTRSWNRDLLRDYKIQIIGYGNIGKQITSILTLQGVKPLVWDPDLNFKELDWSADIIIFCCSLTESSYHFLDKESFKKLSPDVCLINPARGKVICEKSLIHFLSKNTNACAYLDVFEKEPHTFDTFAKLSNIKLSSHIAGVYKKLDDKIISFVKESVFEFLKQEKP